MFFQINLLGIYNRENFQTQDIVHISMVLVSYIIWM